MRLRLTKKTFLQICMLSFLLVSLIAMAGVGICMFVDSNIGRVEEFTDVASKDIEEGKIVMREDRPFTAEEMAYAFNKDYSLFVIKLKGGQHVEYAIHKTNEKNENTTHEKELKLDNSISSLTEKDVKTILSACDDKEYCMIKKIDDKTLMVRT